ncbi:thiazolylpeptide-type bacteriocin [Streptosporangium sandarakinum]|jgi:hypothetical protein|uniref:Thiazolylpeptide-type bacteriocin n=1 Tax=Nonomuraea bangladeshensis TaxID=404385 RepID=A0ABV3GXE7_9ACTN|nr:thiazolylpeptide-type bacteriocin [Nonomuraea sp. LP-02]MED7925258.1 thiazolylpeptide-type bacteriocin [Nonomuraea sp. LP-02]
MTAFPFEVTDLNLEELSVTAMRDSVALPETAASGCLTTSSCCSCIQPT